MVAPAQPSRLRQAYYDVAQTDVVLQRPDVVPHVRPARSTRPQPIKVAQRLVIAWLETLHTVFLLAYALIIATPGQLRSARYELLQIAHC
eukprot:3315391-Amphidinium_carterae.1